MIPSRSDLCVAYSRFQYWDPALAVPIISKSNGRTITSEHTKMMLMLMIRMMVMMMMAVTMMTMMMVMMKEMMKMTIMMVTKI